MRDEGIHEGLGDSALSWIGGLAKEVLGQLVSEHRHKAGVMLQEQLDYLLDSLCGEAGYDPDALLTGVETRTSAPIRITRGANFQSLNVSGLYPAGEGAGYAGGILSAAVDGIKVAEAAARAMANEPAHQA